MSLSNSYLDSVCTIKSMQNEILFKGKIVKVGDGFVDVADPHDEPIPLFAFGIQVKLEIPGGKDRFRILTGKTYISNKKFLRISNPSTMSEFDQRLYFRMRINDKVHVFVPSLEHPKDPDEGEMFDADIIDLSLGGLQFRCEKYYNINRNIFLTIDIFNKEMFLPSKIRRTFKNEDDHNYYYGCEFLQITEKQQDFIYKFLLQKEMEDQRRKKEKESNKQ